MDSDPYKRGIRQKILTIVQHSRRLLTREDHLSFSTEERNRLLSDLLHLEQTATFPGTTSAQLSWLYQRAIDLYNNYLQQRGKRASTSNERTDTSAEEEEHTIPYKPVPIGQHVLPPLPYPYDALEPHIDEKTMRLHHDKHHKSYVDGLNKAERMMAKARKTGDFELIKHWEREAAFNGAGHYLHTIFWDIMGPREGGKPTGEIKKQIQHDFGSFESFKKHFSYAAEKVEGGGWAILVWSPRSHRLEILQAEKHQNLSQWDVIPLLVLDVWEHAYYLKYHNDRKRYIHAWWNVVRWSAVNHRYLKARKLRWKPY